MDDLISRQAAIYAVNTALFPKINTAKDAEKALRNLPSVQPETHEKRTETHACDCISRKEAIDALMKRDKELRNINWYDKPFAEGECKGIDYALEIINTLPSAQPEIVRCKDCEYGKQDEYGRWYCRGFGCQVGDEDGNGFCSDAERKNNV